MALDPLNIPSLSAKVDGEVKRAFDAIKNWMGRVAGNGGFVTQDSLAGSLFDVGALSGLLDSSIPPQLTNFQATGAFSKIILVWDNPRYKWLAFVEIWRSEVDDIGQADMIGTTRATVYADSPPNASLSKTYFYWGRIVSTSGRQGPYNAVAGTPASTANDPAYMIDLLSKSLDAISPTNLGSTKIVIPAESFALRMKGADPATNTYPFIVAQVPEQPAGTYGVFMNTAYITDLTATNIRAGGIGADRLSVVDLAAISANMGDITAGSINLGSNRFVVDTAGNLTMIGSTINIRSGVTGGVGLEITNDTIKVFDTAGTLRVKIGKLT